MVCNHNKSDCKFNCNGVCRVLKEPITKKECPFYKYEKREEKERKELSFFKRKNVG